MHPDAVATIFRRNMISLVDERKARDSRRRLRRRPPTTTRIAATTTRRGLSSRIRTRR